MTLRLIPAFPFFLVNLVSGLTRGSNLATYIGATALGIIPGSFVFAFAGRQLGTINSLSEIASPPVLLAFTFLGLLAIMPIVYRKINRERVARVHDILRYIEVMLIPHNYRQYFHHHNYMT